MRRLAFDLRTRHLTGIYRYGSCLLGHLSNCLPGTNTKLYVLYRPDIQKQVDDTLRPITLNDHVEFVLVPDDDGRIPHSPWLRHWLVSENIQMYYSVNFLVNIRCPIPFVYTVHDLIPLKYPEYFYTDDTFRDKFGVAEFHRMKRDLQRIRTSIPTIDTPRQRNAVLSEYGWAMNWYLKEQSKHIVTVSEAVREDLIRYLSVPPSRISVISGAADSAYFYPRNSSEITTTVQKLGLPEYFCLCVGRDLKHKRLPWLIETLVQYPESLPRDARLAIVGNHADLGQIRDLVHFYHLDQRVTFTGRVDDDELACLYSGARALIVASIDEGFCLPAVEALSCGIEVIVPDTRVLREIVGLSGHFYEVNDRKALAKLLLAAFDGFLISKASTFEDRFNWASSARQLLELLLRLS